MNLDISQQKHQLRNHFKKLRLELDQHSVELNSSKIINNLITNLLIKFENLNQLKIAIYLDAFNEVKTKLLIDYCLKEQIFFGYPKISSTNNQLIFLENNQQLKFQPHPKFSRIIEPISGQEFIPEIIITPLVAFDQYRNRLGMGMGYYDSCINSLKKQNSKIKTIGLGYDFQEFKPSLPIEKHDLSLDYVVSNKIIY